LGFQLPKIQSGLRKNRSLVVAVLPAGALLAGQKRNRDSGNFRMGIVYILTNIAMPGIVKIGMTEESDANARIGQLYTTGVPFPFELAFACKVDNPIAVERALHVAFAPHRKNSKREFFWIDPEQAIAILRLLNKPDVTQEVQSQSSGVDEASLQAVATAKQRRPNLNFREMGIPVGSSLESTEQAEITVLVAGDRKVKLGGDELSLSAATQQVLQLDYAVRPASYWRFQGRLLSEIYEDTYTNIE
jgi:hypothetical protein